jgi:hypothetical protein
MKKEYLIILSILIGSIIVATATYRGTTYEFRSKLKVCEEHYKTYIKKIEKCKKAARFENFGNYIYISII